MVFSLVIHSCISVFCMYLFISVTCLSWIELNFKTKIRICHLGHGFASLAFFKSCLECVKVYFHLKAFFEYSEMCFHVVYRFGYFVMIFSFPYFAGISSFILPHTCWQKFLSLFCKTYFVCIVCSCLGIFLVFLLSPALFDESLRVVFFVLVMFFFA